MKVNVVVSKGIGKKTCEDSVLLGHSVMSECDAEIEVDLPTTICVADGVGGNLGGEIASHFLLNEISKFQESLFCEDVIRRQLLDTNEKLLEYANETDNKQQMATTLTGLFITEEELYYAQSGNTRLYIMQGNYLKQITKDHTTYQWLLDCGNEEAAKLCNRNEIRCCFGGGSEKFINQLVVKSLDNWSNVSTVLLTSDGIHEYKDIDTLEELLISGMSDIDIAKKMSLLATENGSQDDKTTIIIRR